MDSNNYKLEEYKFSKSLIIDIEKRMLQSFGLTVVVSVSLLSAITSLTFGGGDNDDMSIALAYVCLAPLLILIPSFYLILYQRTDAIRLGAYLRVFFEEINDGAAWEKRLDKFRHLKKGESSNAMPYSFWAIFGASSLLFGYRLIQAGDSPFHLVAPIVPAIFMVRAHYRWLKVIPQQLPKFVDLWKNVQNSGQRNPNTQTP